MNRSCFPIPYRAWLYLVVLFLGYASAGWLLAAFQVPWPIWLGTVTITWYLTKVGPDAIAIASGWVVAIISIGAVEKAWAPVWSRQTPYQQAQLWASGLLLLWFWAVLLVLMLAFADRPLQQLGWLRQRVGGLLGLMWLALALGGGLGYTASL